MTKEERREYNKKYHQSSKGKEAQKTYFQSSKGKKSLKKYSQSPKGKEVRRKATEKYLQTPEGKKHHKEYKREYQRNIRRENPKNRLDSNMRCLTWLALKGKKAGLKWESLVGYTINDLMKHLEKQFDDKMTWDNYGSYWWIDHIKARSLFKYETAESPEFKKCWALDNLQPLEKIANIKKKNH